MDDPSEDSPENDSNDIGVIGKAAFVMSTLESGPATLARLVSTTCLARPTAHRIAIALGFHHLVTRSSQGRLILGPRLAKLASATGEGHLLSTTGPVLATLHDKTHESTQLYRHQGGVHIYVAGTERPIGLRDSIPVDATMSVQGDSAAQVLLAWEEPGRLHRGLVEARSTITMLSAVRCRGWVQSVGEHEPGVASASAPACSPGGKVMVIVPISGPIERMERQSGRVHGHMVTAATRRLSETLTSTSTV